uniref:DAGKc domain-containing protein n=1 Tax=Meloidogyne javanica TaxID=6303 RepID=A0A915N4N0_MELJA
MICIYHNYRELETFCIHPLLFSHDLISKETRLLFCIKDQIDGSIRYKFRVKFVSQDEVIAFCSAVAGYVTIKSYEEWSKQSEGARTPTFSERGRTPMSEKGNITPLEQTFDTTIVNETDASESVSANRAPPEDKTGTNGPNIINVHIENLISVEAMREFGNILLQIVDKCISSNKKERNKKNQIQQEGPDIQSTSTIQPALPSTTKLPTKRGRKPHPENNENKSPKPAAKKRRDMNPSKWRIYDFERQLLQMVKEEKAEIHRARKMSLKLKRFAEAILRHKKKSIFAVVVAVSGGNALNSKIKDDEVRRFYGEKAKQFGAVPIHPNQKLRKVIVLINSEAKRQHAARIFNKNGLPLLNLAGLDINILNVSSQSEMENIARTIDYKEADCIFLVGGDGTICHALNGILQKTKIEEQPPIGIFPGGNRNKTFSIFGFIKESVDPKSNVRLCCESVMALIEGKQKQFYPICCKLENISDKEDKEKTENTSSTIPSPSVSYFLSEIALGWFEHCELKIPKFWWMGPLSGYFTYFWEFFKISPKAPIRVEIAYEKFCPGCRKCIEIPKDNGSFLTWISGTSNKIKDPKLTKLIEKENPSCGEINSIAVSGTDFRLNAEQSETNIEAKRIILRFTNIPPKLRKLTISGDSVDFYDYAEKELIVETMSQPLNFFVPNLKENEEKQ